MKKKFQSKKNICEVTFSLPAEAAKEAKQVQLLGDFNEWNIEKAQILDKQKDGSFETKLSVAIGKKYEFRYYIDQSRWENDWQADAYVPSPYDGIDNSVLILDDVSTPDTATAEEVVPSQTNDKTSPKPDNKKAKKASSKKSEAKADKLTLIEGIGPKIAEILQDANITTFSTLAETSVEKLKEILLLAGNRYKVHDPSTWAEQAGLAANGKMDELKVLQEKLKGGKKAE